MPNLKGSAIFLLPTVFPGVSSKFTMVSMGRMIPGVFPVGEGGIDGPMGPRFHNLAYEQNVGAFVRMQVLEGP